MRLGVSPILFYDAVERVVATLHPNHTYEKIVFDPWQQTTYDVNDTVTLVPSNDNDVKGFFIKPDNTPRIDTSEYLPTWCALRTDAAQATAAARRWPDAQLRDAERAAANKAKVHANTPTVAYVDTLGRPFLTLTHNRFVRDRAVVDEKYPTRVTLDIEGNQREVLDAKDRVVMRYDYDMLGNRIHQASMEAGERWMLSDVAGKAIRAWDSRLFMRRMTYDVLRRSTALYVTENGVERQAERTIYGEGLGDAANHRTRVYRVFDGAGVIASERYDFKGNLLQSSRTLADDYKKQYDWAVDAVQPSWGTYTSSTTYDALNRPTSVTTPDSSVYHPTFNEANLLEKVDVNLRGATTATPFVTNINYNTKGQREVIVYANGAQTTYEYDPLTFRLIHLKTTRSARPNGLASQLFADTAVVQDLRYTYDPVGNITRIEDAAIKTVFHNGQQVEPICEYTYDAIYRLTEAKGREHIGQTGADFSPPYGNARDYPFVGNRAHPNDPQALRNYTERYEYDSVGNLKVMQHVGRWKRTYDYQEDSLIEPGKKSNRLSKTTVGNGINFVESYTYTDSRGNDVHGSMTAINSMTMSWDFEDQLQQVGLGGGGTAYYVYDAGGQRVCKVIESQHGTRQKERIYLGGFEVYREYNGNGVSVTLERETLHVMDDKQRIALVETKTKDISQPPTPTPQPLIRYQFANHLGSASVELAANGAFISYEEYYPYGTTAFQISRTTAEPSLKRYRYTGKERDEESGLYYHGARYYAPWLGRWTRCDQVEKVNRYMYVSGSPIRLFDPDGKDESEGVSNFWGGMRMVGGAGQLVLGGFALLAPEPTGITKVIGWVAVVNGTDDFVTGFRQMVSGRQERGAIETTVTVTAQAAGMSPESAEALGTGTSIALGFVSPTGPMTSGPRAVPALVRLSTGERVVVTATADMTRIAEHARGAQVAANGARAVYTMMMSANGGNVDSSPTVSQSSSSSSGPVSSVGPQRSQIPDEYFDEAMSRIDQGELRASGAHLDDLTNHAQSARARAEREVSGRSAHISARSAMRDVAEYNPRAALTRLLDATAHRTFDDYWKRVFRQMANSSGESTISVRDYFNTMRDAIGNNPYFANEEANSMVELLRDELFVQHGLRDDDSLRLPYSK